jgi:hypothetical protein
MLLCKMDPTKFRLRYLLGILVAAVVTAAGLRHFLHVDAGYTREEVYFSWSHWCGGGAVRERLSFGGGFGLLVLHHE